MTSPRGEEERGSPTKEPYARPAADRNFDKAPDWSRDLVQHSRDLLCVHNLKGQLLAANPESARLLRYTVEELLRIPMREMLPPEIRPQFEEYLEKISREGEAHGLLALTARSGEKRIWEYHNTLHRPEGAEPVVHGIAHDVTDRVRAEKALREANEKLEQNMREQESTLRELKLFRTLLDRTTDAIGVLEPYTLRFLDVNARACTELGYSREELLAMTAFDLDPSLTPEVAERMQAELLKDGFSTLTGVHRRKDGTTFPVEVYVRCVHLERDYMVAVSRDITERKKAEESLRRSEERYRSVVAAMTEGVLLRDATGTILACNPSFKRLLGVTDKQMLGTTAADWEHRTIHEDGTPFPGAEHPSMVALRTGQPQSNICMGFRREDETVCWLSINAQPMFRDGESKPYAVVTTFTNITERKRAEEALRASEARLRSVLDNLQDAYFRADLSGRFTVVSPSAPQMYGYDSMEEMIGLPAEKLYAEPEARALLVDAVRRSGRVNDWPARGKRKDGTTFWVSMNIQACCDDAGQIVGTEGVVRDITKRKLAEEALRKSAAELREAQRLARMGSWYRDLKTDICVYSEEACRLLGLDPGKPALTLSEVEKFYTPEEWQRVQLATERLIRTGKPDHLEVEIHNKEGKTGWAVLHREPVFDQAGAVIGLRGTALDITERKHAEEALRASEERMRLAQQVAQIGTFERNMQTGEGFWAPETEKIFGLQPGQGPKSLEAFYNLAHPEDRQHVEHLIAESIEAGSVAGEWRVIWPDGSVHWIDGRWRVFKDAQGRPLRAIGVDTDITERKRAEEALRESEAKERAHARELETILDTLPIPVLIARDPQCSQITANRAGYEHLRLPPGTNVSAAAWREHEPRHRFLQNGVEVPKEQLPMDRAAATGRPVRGVNTNLVFADGVEKYELGNAAPLFDEHGNVRGAIGAAIDLTDRVRAEEALRESEERLRLAQEVAHIGTFDRNFLTGDGRWTPEMKAMYGLPGREPTPTLEQVAEMVYPDDRQMFSSLLSHSMESGEGGGEWRVVWPDRSVHWVASRWRVFKDLDGKPIRMIGIDYDITNRKRIEQELQQAKEKLTEEKLYLEHTYDAEMGFEDIVGKSKGLKQVMDLVAKVAASDATVLLLGETGVGKELVARAIHRLSLRKQNSFIKMNCAAIPSGLLESELFGAEKGAYTGAVSRKIGRLELADKGTIFLDEIGEIALSLQPKLLRVLQDQEFERLGGTQTLKVDFRLIAATNRDLAEEVEENKFRSDLYYRLNVFPIRVPPLRERHDDIPLLVEHFVQKCARRMNKSIVSIPKKTMDALCAWHWPGNVRELENFIERSVILTHGSVLAAPLGELRAKEAVGARPETLEAAERKHILEALRLAHGRISGERGAAARLGLKRTTLQSKLKQMGINPRTPPPN